METKRLILSVVIMIALVAVWKMSISYVYRLHPEWVPSEQAQVESAPVANTSQPSPIVGATTGPTTSAVASVISPTGGLHAIGSDISKPTELGSVAHADKTYSLALSIDPNGAGISSVTLNDFYDTAQQKALYTFQKPLDNFENATRPLSTESVTVNGNVVNLSNTKWTLVSADSSTATYTATITDGVHPQLEIAKTFQVFPRNTEDGRGGFEVLVSQNFHNLTNALLNVKASINGPTPLTRENDRSEDREFIAGYDKGYSEVDVTNTAITSFTKAKPIKDLVADDKRALLWVGAENGYFDAIVRPEPSAVKIAAAPATGYNLDAPPDDHTAALAIETNQFNLAPAASAPLNLRVFFGPKKRDLLKNAYYSSFPLGYENTLVTSGGMCGFLTFGWLINVLYGILWFFHKIFLSDWGLAIIGLVCLVRLILHPITKKSQVNMMSMGKMGPEIERLKKKHGDNKDELNKAMMQVYKQQGFTPVLGCLPMFLQMPIWIALWSALQSTFDLRQAGFLRFGWLHLTWINDLSHPDALVALSQPFHLPILGWAIHSINVLPVLLGVVSFIQTKLQPVPSTQTPEQEKQRKMMQWMVLLFPVMLYSAPSGLNLYILTSTTLGIFENKIIRRHIKEKEEAEKAGRIIVDAKPTRAGRQKKNEPVKPEKKTGVMGWVAGLQAKAEEIRRDAERRGKDRA